MTPADQNVDIDGYLQSEKYFSNVTDEIKNALAFKFDFKQQVREKFKQNDVFEKCTIAISIRRGDYVNNPNYVLMPITYYILALFENFSNWRDCNLVIFSDDIPYCRRHFDCLPNAYFSENNSDIEDICLMSQCDHFILSNSTFSWWGAYLGEKFHSKIIRPNYLFAGRLLELNDWSDFYPERWTTFDHVSHTGENKKINLQDTTFTIPVAYDHQDRKENLDLCIAMIKKYFNTNIIVFEQHAEGTPPAFEYLQVNVYYSDPYKNKFHRTKMLNEMAKISRTQFIFNWDADIFIAPLQIWEAINHLRAGADMVYPYGWAFARIPRKVWFETIRKHEDIGIVGDTIFRGMMKYDTKSLGGAVGFNKEKFIEGGMENENFISYGAEDSERMVRFYKLGYKIERTYGPNMYHIDHFVGPNSNISHPDYNNNCAEFAKIDAMTKEELQAYIKTWSWVPTKLHNVMEAGWS